MLRWWIDSGGGSLEHREARQAGLLRHEGDGLEGGPLADGWLVVGGLFPTPVVSARVADAGAVNAALRAVIEERRAGDPGVSVSNVGGWHSADLMPWAGAAGQAVLDAARHVVGRMTAVEEGDALLEADVDWEVSAWANVSTAGAANRPHAHPGAFWSGVYWVDDGGIAADPSLGGLLEFADPRGVLPSMAAPRLRVAVQDCLSAGRGEVVTPEAGLMVLFPSWLVHAVTPYRGGGTRISVAFNFGA